MKKSLSILASATLLSACASPLPVARYGISADNRAAIQKSHAKDIGVGPFVASGNIDPDCRGQAIVASDGMSYEAYVEKALSDELKVADAYADRNASVTLSGKLEALESSSSVRLTNGYWNIRLLVSSSNGKSLSVAHKSSFTTAFEGTEACHRVADQFPAAVQDVIHELVTNAAFPSLLQ